MTKIQPDNTIKSVQLTGDQIKKVTDALESSPMSIYEFLNYKEIIIKLKEAQNEKGV